MSLAYQAVQILYWLALSVWLGSMVFLAAGAPAIFRAVRNLDARSGKHSDPALDEQQTTIVAGGVIGSLLDRLMQIQLVCAGAMLPLMVGQLLLIDLTATNRTAAIIRAVLWLLALGIFLYDWRIHHPRTWALRQRYLDNADDPEVSGQAREQFHRQQRRGDLLFQITVFLLIGLVVLSANIQPRPRVFAAPPIEAGQ
jgi:hypothetical protein